LSCKKQNVVLDSIARSGKMTIGHYPYILRMTILWYFCRGIADIWSICYLSLYHRGRFFL